MKKLSLLLILALVLGLLSSVPRTSEAQSTFTCPSTGGTLVVTGTGDPQSLSGLYSNDGNSLAVTTFISEPLIFGGENYGDKVEPVLAESWDVSKDGLVYTFKLRHGVKWHDGQNFTAKDVLFTYQAVLEEDNTIGWRANLLQNGKPIKFEAVDEYTVKVTLNEPNAAILTALGIPIVPAHAFESTKVLNAPYNTKPIATGPFKFAAWNTGQNVTLDANKDYWGGAPCVDRIVVRFIDGAQNLANALLAGEVDFARVDGADLSSFKDNPKFKQAQIPRDLMRFIGFNTRSEAFSDPAVRRALSVGLDRQAIINVAGGGYGVIPDSVFNRSFLYYQQGRNKPYAYDQEQAKKLLADAGWKETNSSGFLVKNGKELKLRLVYLGSWALMQSIAPVVYDNWRKLGVNVELVPQDQATSNQDIYDNTKVDKPYDAFLGGWGLFGPDPDHYRGFFADETSYFAYNNPDITKLFAQGRTTVAPEDRAKIYSQIDEKLWQELPIIPIFQPIGVYVYRSDLNLDAAEINGTFLTGLKYPARAYFTK